MTDELETQVVTDAQVGEDVTEDNRAEEVDMTGVMIDGKRYELKKMKAKQVAKLSNVIGRALMAGTVELNQLRKKGTVSEASLVMSVLAIVDDKMLITLAAALVDVDEKFVEENFDLMWVTDALVKQIRISNIIGIIQNFTLLSSHIQ